MERTIYTKEELAQKFAALPANIASYVYSSDMEEALQAITEKHQIHIDQMGVLETEVVDTLIGAESGETFTSRITESLEINETKASAVADDVNRLVFLKIRESMQEASEAKIIIQPEPPPLATSKVPAIAEPLLPTMQTQTLQPVKKEPPSMPAAEQMLTQKTVSTPTSMPATSPTTLATPTSYKTDPYREPPE